MRNLFFVIALIPYLGAAQEKQELRFDYQIIYKMQWYPDSTNQEHTREESAELLVKDSGSLFQTVLRGKIDSVNYVRFSGQAAAPHHENFYTHFKAQVLKDGGDIWTTDIIAPDLHNAGEIFRKYNENTADFNWKIHRDTTHINGLVCQLATVDFGNRQWLAWFAADIPISDGPYKFCGLPGLIVRMYDQQKYWTFELEHIKQQPKIVVLDFSTRQKPVPTTKAKFFADKQHYHKNYLEIQEANGIDFISAENRMIIKKNVEQAFREDNNWIELYP